MSFAEAMLARTDVSTPSQAQLHLAQLTAAHDYTAISRQTDGVVMHAAQFGHADVVMTTHSVSGFNCMLFRWMRMRRCPLGTRPPHRLPSQSWPCRRASAGAPGRALPGWTMSPPLVMSVTLPLACLLLLLISHPF